MAKKRSIKVYGQSGYKYQETPTIMLKGMWLKELGFDIGDYISVTRGRQTGDHTGCREGGSG